MPLNLIEEGDPKVNNRQADVYKSRRAVIRDTVAWFTENQERAFAIAQNNHRRWGEQAAASLTPTEITVLNCDWGEAALKLAKESGTVFALLNNANALGPGGGYRYGDGAQEENIFRRTDCHFSLLPEEFDSSTERYTSEMTALINGTNGRVYCDKKDPRICFKGPEKKNEDRTVSYDYLSEDDYFLFYELRSAADDLRPTLK